MGWTLTSTPAPRLGPPLLPGTPWTTTTLRPGPLNQPRLLRLAIAPALHPPAKSQGRAKRTANARPRRMRTTEQLATTVMQIPLGTPALTVRVLECHLLRPPVRTSSAPWPRVRVKSQGRAKRRTASARPRRMRTTEQLATMAMTTLPATSARAVCALGRQRRRQKPSPRRPRRPRLLSTARGPGLNATAHARENTPSPLLLSMAARTAPSPT